jgi:prepilin-type N-terminal cleavage/methylation domain-containing protein
MQRNQQGFTLVEITAVLVLMAIISAYVIGRSVNTEQIANRQNPKPDPLYPGGGHETVR